MESFLIDHFSFVNLTYLCVFMSFFLVLFYFSKFTSLPPDGRSEIECIIDKYPGGFSRTYKIENSLNLSKNKMIRDGIYSVSLSKFIKLVLEYENFENKSPLAAFKISLVQIRGYRCLVNKVKSLKETRFEVNNSVHIDLLKAIWNGLLPSEPFSLNSKLWSDIGFQGTDPSTDFRGMGILGAQNLVYFVKHFHEDASNVHSGSADLKYWYPFATAGINLSDLTWRLLKDGFLKTHFYNSFTSAPSLNNFHEVYVSIFVKFHKLWMKQPRSVMEFNSVLKYFEKDLRKQLESEDFKFTLPGYN